MSNLGLIFRKEGTMFNKRDIRSVRTEVNRYMGTKVKVKTNLGRNKVDVMEGVIAEAYPSIFLIQIEATGDMPQHKISYSYNDVITHDIELVVCQ